MIGTVAATLYVIPGSHPSMAARRMLEAKRIPYRRRDLMPVVAKGVLRAAGFPGTTVPALKVDGKRVQGTRAIAGHLDQIRATPRLVPEDADQRLKVEAAEQWGDEVLQSAARRILWNSLRRDKAPLRGYSEGAKLGIPIGVAVKTAAPIVAAAARLNSADDEHVRDDLAQLPKMLDTIDGWIAEGVIGAEQPNVADFQIAASLRLLMTVADIRPAIEGRPAGELAMRLIPDFPGHVPPVLPLDWVAPLRGAASA
jgi:glutathione S-transferase